MPATRTEKVYRPRDEIRPFVERIQYWWCDGILRKDIAGSLRRHAPEVGDLDVAVVTETGRFGSIKFPDGFVATQQGDEKVMGEMTVNGVTIHVDFWATKPEDHGALMAYITGPRPLVVQMRRDAKVLGWLLNQHGLWGHGIANDGEDTWVRIDDGTEMGIFRKLYPYQPDKWLTPEQRQEYAARKPVKKDRVRTWRVPSGSRPFNYIVVMKGEGVHSHFECKKEDPDSPGQPKGRGCESFQYSAAIPPTCKHIMGVQALLRKDGEETWAGAPK